MSANILDEASPMTIDSAWIIHICVMCLSYVYINEGDNTSTNTHIYKFLLNSTLILYNCSGVPPKLLLERKIGRHARHHQRVLFKESKNKCEFVEVFGGPPDMALIWLRLVSSGKRFLSQGNGRHLTTQNSFVSQNKSLIIVDTV